MIHVLVVDDDPPVTRALARSLKRGGYQVSIAASGEEALPLIRDNRPDVVITDFHMPTGMSGAELLGVVRTELPRAVRVLLSGYADLGASADDMMDGVYVVNKPWEDRALLNLLAKALSPSTREQG